METPYENLRAPCDSSRSWFSQCRCLSSRLRGSWRRRAPTLAERSEQGALGLRLAPGLHVDVESTGGVSANAAALTSTGTLGVRGTVAVQQRLTLSARAGVQTVQSPFVRAEL